MPKIRPNQTNTQNGSTPSGRYQTMALSLALSDLQSAGDTCEADFVMGPALPPDSRVVGLQIDVTEEMAGPNLASPYATIELAPGSNNEDSIRADLMTLGSYDSGGQVYQISVYTQGCPLMSLTAGALTGTVYYSQVRL